MVNPFNSARVEIKFAKFDAQITDAQVCLSNIKFRISELTGSSDLATGMAEKVSVFPTGKEDGGFDVTYFYSEAASGYALNGIYFENPIPLLGAGTSLGMFNLPAGKYDQVTFGLSNCKYSQAAGLSFKNANGAFSDSVTKSVVLPYNQVRDFSNGGIQEFDITGLMTALATVQSSGDLQTVLASYRHFELLGFTSSRLPGSGDLTMRKVVGQPDGKSLAVGLYNDGNSRVVVARYNVDGSLDTEFAKNSGHAGMAEAAVELANGVNGMTVDKNTGEIYVVSNQYVYSRADYDIAVIKFTAEGELDTGFGSGGRVLIDSNDTDNYGDDIVVDANGKILVVGEENSNKILVARLNANGTFDATFGQAGKVAYSANYYYRDYHATAALQTDGGIVLALHNNIGPEVQWRVMRLQADGQMDSIFNAASSTPGNLYLGFGGNHFAVTRGLALQGDGKIVVTGVDRDLAVGNESEDFVAVRINTDGSLDSSFGASGVFRHSQVGYESASGVSIKTDGTILLSGVRERESIYAYKLLSLKNGSVEEHEFLASQGAEGGFIYTHESGRAVIGGSFQKYFHFLNLN